MPIDNTDVLAKAMEDLEDWEVLEAIRQWANTKVRESSGYMFFWEGPGHSMEDMHLITILHKILEW